MLESVFLVSSFIFLQPANTLPPKREIVPPRIRFQSSEEVFLGDDIGNVYLGSKSETRAGRPVLAMFRKEIGKGEVDYKISFLDSNFSTIRELPIYGSLVVSKNSEYAAIFSPVVVEHHEKGSIGLEKWNIFNRSGQKKWEKYAPILPDISRNWLILSDAGIWVEIDNIYGSYIIDLNDITIYKKKGKRYQKVMLKETKSEWNKYIQWADLSEDGRYLILSITSEKGDPRERNEVLLYNTDGEKIWSFVPDERFQYRSLVSISHDGSYSLAVFYNLSHEKGIVYLLDRNGDVIASTTDFVTSEIRFSSSGNYTILINRPARRVMALENETGKVLFNYKVGTSVMDADLAENGKLVGILAGNSIILLNFEGKQIGHIRISPRNLEKMAGLRKISFSDSGEEISAISRNIFYVYKRVD